MKVFHNPDPNIGYFYVLKTGASHSLCLRFNWVMARNGSFGPEIQAMAIKNSTIIETYRKDVELDESRPDICHGWIVSLFKNIFSIEYKQNLQVIK